MERLRLDAQAQAHVRAYVEYRAIVGDADGGELLSEEEYAAFRARAIEARRNRLYVCFRCVSSGVDCKNIGPQSKCFCGHRYRDHATDDVEGRRVCCRVPRCRCALFEYVPSHGSFVTKCTCKHEPEDHDETGMHRCKKCACSRFHTSWSCSCGQPWADHATVFESREEREADGRPVDNLAGGGEGYEALGGITNFSSLVDGVDRLQVAGPSGAPARGRLAGGSAVAAGTSGAGAGDDEGDGIVVVGDQFVPRSGRKMTEQEEMDLYARKFDRKPAPRRPVQAASAAARPSAAPAPAPAQRSRVPDATPAVAPAPAPGAASAHAASAGPTAFDEDEDATAALREEIARAQAQEEQLADQLQAPGVSQAKAFALKKQLQLARANRLKLERRLAQP